MSYANDPTSGVADENNGDVSLHEIIYRLWRQRGILIVVPLLAVCFTAMIVGFTAWTAQNPIVYYVALSNIDKGQYPNGAAFSPQDLLNADVLAKLRQQFKLKPDTDLRRGIQVGYDNPIANSVTKKYHERLASKTLAQADIDAINDAYKAELTAAMNTGLRIDVNYLALDVSSATGMAIARALPQIWSSVYSEQYRVFLDTKLVHAAITTGDEKLENASSILVIDARLNNISDGLGIIGRDNRLAALTTDDGLSAGDIQQEMDRFKTVYFSPFFATGFSDNDPASQAYLRDRRLDIEDLERRVAGIDRNLVELRDYQAAATNRTVTVDGDAKPDTNSIGVDDGALGQIIGLAKAVSFSDYLTKLLDQRQDLISRISTLRKQIDLATTMASTISDRATFRQQASEALQTLTGNYQNLLEKARARTMEYGRQFYTELSSPVIAGSLLPTRAVVSLILAFLAGLFVAVIYALMKPLLSEPASVARQGRRSFDTEPSQIPESRGT